MTNYEWLIKHDNFATFMGDFACAYSSFNEDDFLCAKRDFIKKYNIHYDDDPTLWIGVARWLQEEHPVEKYIKYGDVISALGRSASKYQGATVVYSYIGEVKRELSKREVKEIEV